MEAVHNMARSSLLQVRRDTAANWASVNPIMASGEPGYDTTNKILKIGDGTTAWASLAAHSQQTGTIATWSEITDTTKTIVINYGYIANNGSQVVFTLPSTAAVGSVIRIVGKGAGGWKIEQNASQYIRVAGSVSTTGITGYVSSSAQYDCIELVCTVANVEFTTMSSMGNLTVA
jgi:hypothetical protein